MGLRGCRTEGGHLVPIRKRLLQQPNKLFPSALPCRQLKPAGPESCVGPQPKNLALGPGSAPAPSPCSGCSRTAQECPRRRAGGLEEAEVTESAAPELGTAGGRLPLHVSHFVISPRLPTQAPCHAPNGRLPPAEPQLSKNPARRET